MACAGANIICTSTFSCAPNIHLFTAATLQFQVMGKPVTGACCDPAGLESLSWAGNGLTCVPSEVLASLEHVTHLDLSHNQLTSFETASGQMRMACTPLEQQVYAVLDRFGAGIDFAAVKAVWYGELEDEAVFRSALGTSMLVLQHAHVYLPCVLLPGCAL